eukprot:443324-Pyramimonas_sp.AAC.1
MDHILFQRGHWDALRAPLLEHYSVEALLQLPVCLRQCGLMPDRPEYDAFFGELLPDEPDLPPPPHYENGGSAEQLPINNGFAIVAGDGACPGQASDLRLRRSGYSLYHGHNHSCNVEMPLRSVYQGAKGAEVAALRHFVSWSWGPQLYLTDSSYCYRQFSALLRGEPISPQQHQDLWAPIATGVRAKGPETFRIQKKQSTPQCQQC